MRRPWRIAAGAILVLLVAPAFAPELLAFPYQARSHGSRIWSETSIRQTQLDLILKRSADLVGQSPIAQASEPRQIFLTKGGWRYTWLAVRNRSAFGISRPGRETIVINRNDLAADRVFNGQSVGGVRSLSGVIAHETCHGMLRRHFGITVDLSVPTWLLEGYCDHVSQESSLSAADVARLKASGQDHPALIYFAGRKRVEFELDELGGSVDALFARNGR
ncbi:MAG: hypothetical protein ABIO69_04490 [Sphingomicrobium sp.]